MHTLLKVFLLLFAAVTVSAAVTTAKLPQDNKGNSYWQMENEHLKAVFSSQGGTLHTLIDKKNNAVLLQGEGAFRDQFGSRNTLFAKGEYRGNFSAIRGGAVLELTSPAGDGPNTFTLIRKKYILRENESKLTVEITVLNQTESMQEKVYEYWSNSFFGIADCPNYLFFPTKSGVLKELSGSNIFHKEPVRNWMAFIGGRSGIVLMPEYKKFNLCFSWNCLGSSKRNTLEFRLVKEAVAPGKTTLFRVEAGLLRNMDQIHGAGSAGYGKLELRNNRLTAVLQGFADSNINAVLKVDGKKIASKKVKLFSTKAVTVAFAETIKGKKALLEITGNGGKVLFDLMLPLAKDVEFAPREKRNEPPKDKDPWQYDPKVSYKTPHFKWLDNKKFNILFLTEATGARDIVELHQRMNFDFQAPTLFPRGWTRAWRTKVPFAPASGGESGVERLTPYLAKSYDVIVIGDGNTTVRINRKARKVSCWSAYPEKSRKAILDKVKKGTGLLLINPQDADVEMAKILKSLKAAPAFLTNSMSLSAAPYFPGAKLLFGTYGKGRVCAITFKVPAFIAPKLRYRHKYFQKLSQTHRFQEYQFAILARVINYLRGESPQILSLKRQVSGKLEIECAAPGKYEFELFNARSNSYAKFSAVLEKGKHSISMPQLRNGNNYLHVKSPGKDFAFLAMKFKTPEQITAVKMKNSFKANETVSGNVELSPAAAGLTPELEIIDNLNRILWQGKGKSFKWDARNAAVNRHVLRVTLRKGKRVIDTMEKEFFLPDVFDLRKEYSHLVWVGSDMYPEYVYPDHYEQLRRFGFNFLYGGSFSDGAPVLLRYANVETGMNWHAGGARGYHQSYAHVNKTLEKWYKTGKKEFIVRKPCYNDPAFNTAMMPAAKNFAPFYSRYLFQLGDEMSMTFFHYPFDFCFCPHCLKGFRAWLQKEQGYTLAKLNAHWKTSYKSWDEVMPQTYKETLFQPNPAAFVAHRLYMDHVFATSLERISANIRKEFPNAMVGPTGVSNKPNTYGGNWNFWRMSRFDCASMYGNARIPVSFNREKRFVMSYHGYDSPEGKIRFDIWEGLVAGERNTNHWYSPIYLLPDLSISPVRDYYSKLIWELRSGPGDLLFHAKKNTSQAGILLSQRSVISNFLKQVKADLPGKLFSFAKVLEDLGICHRFVAQEELTPALLKQFKVLILCEASALSDKEIAMIKEFVKQGGKVIADYDAAIQDEFCVNRSAPALNALFGITSMRQVLRKVESHTLKGISIKNAVTGIRCKTGKALGSAVTRRGKAPLAIVNGNTLYLNFEPLYNSQRDVAFRDLIGSFLKLSVPAKFTSKTPVMHGSYTNGKTAHIALLPQPRFGSWENATLAQALQHTVKGKLELEKGAFLYDSTKGKFLGKGKSFDLTLHQGVGTLLSALPYKVAGVKVTVPSTVKAGSAAAVTAQIQTAGNAKAENHVLLFRAFLPDGSESLELRKIRLAPGGKFTFKFSPALNEKGTWHLNVKDAASGVVKELKVTVR